jgi:O-acetyl-ADP-ribose deacetylase (regulator of RNase III)
VDPSILSKIDILQVDITQLPVDAIVNAANNRLLGGGGVDGAIHRAAGPELLAHCRTIGGCPTGEARMTKGFTLPAKYVIHTVGPVYHGRAEDPILLEACYRNSLQLAGAHKLHTVAFPAISCGVYGYPIEEAGQIALKTTIDILNEQTDFKKIFFALSSPSNLDIYQTIIRSLISVHP